MGVVVADMDVVIEDIEAVVADIGIVVADIDVVVADIEVVIDADSMGVVVADVEVVVPDTEVVVSDTSLKVNVLAFLDIRMANSINFVPDNNHDRYTYLSWNELCGVYKRYCIELCISAVTYTFICRIR